MGPSPSDTWYHGSPLVLSVLLSGSTITQDRHLAEVFSLKPTLVSLGDDGKIHHNGRADGLLYRMAEPVGPGDVVPHPRSSMPPGLEWLITRPLRVELIGPVTPVKGERMSPLAERMLVLRARGYRLFARLGRVWRGWCRQVGGGIHAFRQKR